MDEPTATDVEPTAGTTVDAEPERARPWEPAAEPPLPEEMSLARAADFLGVEPRYLVRLMRRGEMPYRRVGKRRLIPAAALIAANKAWYEKAKLAIDEMCRENQEAGLYDLDPLIDPPR